MRFSIFDFRFSIGGAARRFHANVRGAIGVLLLLVIWALVCILGLLWNTSEYATRRRHVQNAADATAQGAANWMARTTNTVCANNMIIAQDAAAEAVWRAVPPTDKGIGTELAAEIAAAQQDPTLRSRLPGLLAAVESNYALLTAAYNSITPNSITFPNQQAATDYATKIRQAGLAINWVESTYVHGGAAGVAGWPGPPGPGGQGLQQMVNQWSSDTKLTDAMRDAILASIQQQIEILQQFEQRTAPATGQDVPSEMANHEQERFNAETTIADQLPALADNQRQTLASFYQVNATLATPNPDHGTADGGITNIPAPVIRASDVASVTNHQDLIRAANADQLPAGLGVDVTIDPINPNTGNDRVWYPNRVALTGVQRPQSVTVVCDIGGGWGHSWGYPLERYVLDRVNNDQQTLRAAYMQPIDTLRQQLAAKLNQISNIGNYQNIAGIPGTLKDPVADAQGNPQTIQVFPNLSVPAGASAPASLRTEIDFSYTRYSASYLTAVNQLASALRQFGAFYNRFTAPLAIPTWDGQIAAARQLVLQNLGTSKNFMVLATYQLRPIPDWAQEDMRASLQVAVRDRIIEMNLQGVTQQLQNGGQSVAAAEQMAYALVYTEATAAATDIATEMLSRPWPYEIAPPDQRPNHFPEVAGLTLAERQQWFTVVAGTQNTDGNAPKLILPKVFGNGGEAIVAYAQGEAFNWNEFSPNWGGKDHYDEVNVLADDVFVASPECWRLCSQGGWAWQPRLSYADGLAASMNNSPVLAEYMKSSGVTNVDAASLEQVNAH